MLQLNNKTPFASSITCVPNEQGIDTLYAVSKARFIWQGQWTLAESQTPPQQADEYYGEPGKSSIKYGSDYHTGKIGTDIVMIGSACAKDRQRVRQLDVTVDVAGYRKAVRVFGDRFWDSEKISQPELFETKRLRFENAFGGEDIAENQLRSTDTRNPVGKGFLGEKKRAGIQDITLPNLEDPANLIQSPADCPVPACFGPLAPNWEPRVGFAGTYDESWTTQRAPFLPQDYSPRFMNYAASELWVEKGLRGGEPVSITNMHPEGELYFKLPEVNIGGKVDVAGKANPLKMVLETLILEPNRLEIAMVWRGAMECDKQLLKVRGVELFLSR